MKRELKHKNQFFAEDTIKIKKCSNERKKSKSKDPLFDFNLAFDADCEKNVSESHDETIHHNFINIV